MTLTEIRAALCASGLPVAYDHFQKGRAPAPPFVVYTTHERLLAADDDGFTSIAAVHVELYTDKKDPAAERRVQDAMRKAGMFPAAAGETYIESENLYQINYDSEVCYE